MEPKKAKTILGKLDHARRMLWLHGMLTENEREKITKRIIKWGKKHRLQIHKEIGFGPVSIHKTP